MVGFRVRVGQQLRRPSSVQRGLRRWTPPQPPMPYPSVPTLTGDKPRSPPRGPGQPQKSDPGQAQLRNRGCQVCRPCFITPEAPRISSVWAPLTPSRMPLRASVAAALTRPRGRGTDNDALIWALVGQGVERMGESAGRVLWFKAVNGGKAAARQSELLAESARQAWHPPGLSWPLARKCLLVPLIPSAAVY